MPNAIASHHELARTFEAELSVPERAVRRWNLVLADNALSGNPLDEQDVISTLGLDTYGAAHPTFSHLGLRKITIVERTGDSPYHAEATAEYTYIQPNDLLAPTNRRADWKFESQSGQIAALRYYHGSGNNDVRPLTNSAYDFFEGLTSEEGMVKITITKNFWPFPNAYFAMQNFVNSADYMTCQQYTLKCTGVTSDYTQVFFNNTTYQYWETQIQLMFRQSGWVLQIPDVGWNFLSGTEKRRAMVFDFKNNEWVASANPVGLDGSGQQTFGQPAILQRRVNPAMDFATLLLVPPTDGSWPTGGL